MRKKRKETIELKGAVVTPDQLGFITDLSERRHEQLAAEGHFPQKLKAGWNLVEVLRGLLRYYRGLLDDSKSGLRTEQEELTRARKEIAKEDLLVIRKLNIPKAEVGAALENASLNMRAELAKLELEIGPKLPMMNHQEQMLAIQHLFDRACQNFRENMRQWLAKPPSPKAR